MATIAVAAPTGGRMRLASPAEHNIFWEWNDDSFPCICCSPTDAMDGAHWLCVSGREWIVVDDVLRAEGRRMVAEAAAKGLFTLSPYELWADLVDEEFAARAAAETPAAKAARLAREAAEVRDRELTCEASKMASYGQHMKIVNTVGRGAAAHIHKSTGPCKWLYCNEKAPRAQWRKNEKGEWCAPQVKFVTGAQCWAWEYQDPKTKQFKKPHSCKYLHPGEPGWLEQWNTNRDYRPDRVADALGAMRGVVPSAAGSGGGAGAARPAVTKPAAKPTNSFAALDNSAW